MNRRLEQFLAAENISQSQFADTLGVARASVSHILAGRNKPGFDFIERMSRHYPTLNIEWFITGTGKMYKGAASPTSSTTEIAPTQPQETVFSPLLDVEETEIPSEPIKESGVVPQKRVTESNTSNNKTQTPNKQRNITKIIVFYDDNSFQELK